MAKNKGVKPQVTLMNNIAKTQPIPRGVDNTDDLVHAEMRVHASHSPIRHPDGTRKGSFDPQADTAYNGNTVVAPTT